MTIKATVASIDEVAEPFRPLYVERDGKYELAVEIEGVQGVKTYSDFSRLNSALHKEREDHKAVKSRLAPLGDRKLEDLLAAVERIPELEAAAGSGGVDEKVQQLLELKLKTATGPLKRELETLSAALKEKETIISTFQKREHDRTIGEAVRKAAVAAKLLPEAIEDALLLAERCFDIEDGRVVTKEGMASAAGLEPSAWFADLQKTRAHWWPASFGGGATGQRGGGSAADNPWTHDKWNVTEQIAIMRTDPARAAQLAKIAGSSIGGTKPPKK